MMNIYPAIDLKDGQAVRLMHGDFSKMTVYAPDPLLQAQKFTDAGCEWIHVVDLDGAVAGQPENKDAVSQILTTGAKIQLGGGIRTMQAIEDWLEAGVSRVILGTAALKDPELVRVRPCCQPVAEPAGRGDDGNVADCYHPCRRPGIRIRQDAVGIRPRIDADCYHAWVEFYRAADRQEIQRAI